MRSLLLLVLAACATGQVKRVRIEALGWEAGKEVHAQAPIGTDAQTAQRYRLRLEQEGCKAPVRWLGGVCEAPTVAILPNAAFALKLETRVVGEKRGERGTVTEAGGRLGSILGS